MNEDEHAAAQVMPALSAKPPSTAAQDIQWGWGKYIGRSILFAVFHILGGPRFAFNMWHASRPLSSHAWQQFIPLSATSDHYAVQVSIAEGRQFSASLFLIAGLIMIGDSPASLQESSFRWQLVTTAAICLVLVSALQAISGPMHKSLYSHALKVLNARLGQGEAEFAFDRMQALKQINLVLHACLWSMSAIPTITFWWMYRLIYIIVLLISTCILESRYMNRAEGQYRRSLTVFSTVITIVFMIILEVWSLAYTYSMDTIESVIEGGNMVGSRAKSGADREATGDTIKTANEKDGCHPKAASCAAPHSKVWEGSI